MQIRRSPVGCTNEKPGLEESRSTRLLSPPRSPKLPKQENQSYQNGAKTSLMSSPRKPMTNSLLTALMITPSNSALTSFPKSQRSTLSTWQKWRLVRTLLKSTSELDGLYPQNPPKPLPSFLCLRRMGVHTHARTII